MQTEMQIDPQQQRKGRMIFVMMAIFFIIPIVVVVLMYKFDWKPAGRSLGELVRPPRLIEASLTMQNHQGNMIKPFASDKWSMVFITEQCEQVCMDKLHDMRQIHVSTYKDMLRVQRVLITQQTQVDAVLAKYPDLLIINQPAQSVEKLVAIFSIGGANALTANNTYLVDPLGHVMMRYSMQSPAANIRKDLSRLLKFSWAG